jgi:DNA-binding MarR family transcriptional regulator
MLCQLEKRRLIEKKKAANDKRSFYLFLSRKGKLEFEKLNVATQEHATQLLVPLKNAQIVNLINYMEAIRQILTNANI